MTRDGTRRLTTGQLDVTADVTPFLAETLAEEVETVVDVVLNLKLGAAEKSKAVEVAQECQ